jgi:aminomethyltransferase
MSITVVEFRAAREAAAVMDRSAIGRLRIAGGDRLNFLQRMSTNDVLRLQPGKGAVTILTTPIGRIVDRLISYAEDETLLALTSEGQAERVRKWLTGYIFFMDQVTIADETELTALLAVYGPRAAEVIQAATAINVSVLDRHAWTRATFDGAAVTAAAAEPLGAGGAFYLIAPATALPGLRTRLLEAGAHPMGEAAYEALRILAGQPRYGHELSEEYIPLEAGLWNDVSFSKGCYIGQEIIARMESRGKQARQLVGLRLAELPLAGDAGAQSIAPLQAKGQRIGQLTSVARLPDSGEVAGLGYVRTAYATPGAAVSAVAAGREIPGEITFLAGSAQN